MVLLHTLRTVYYVCHGAFRSPKLGSILERGHTSIYAGFRAADMFLHINNARYLEYFEFARWHHSARAGIADAFRATGIYPVVGAVHVQYLKEIKPFQHVDVSTEVVGAHRRSIIVEQRITTQHPKKGEVLHATMMLKATFLRKGRPIEIHETLDAYGIDRKDFVRRMRVTDADALVALQADEAPDAADVPDSVHFDMYNQADDMYRALVRKA